MSVKNISDYRLYTDPTRAGVMPQYMNAILVDQRVRHISEAVRFSV